MPDSRGLVGASSIFVCVRERRIERHPRALTRASDASPSQNARDVVDVRRALRAHPRAPRTGFQNLGRPRAAPRERRAQISRPQDGPRPSDLRRPRRRGVARVRARGRRDPGGTYAPSTRGMTPRRSFHARDPRARRSSPPRRVRRSGHSVVTSHYSVAKKESVTW